MTLSTPIPGVCPTCQVAMVTDYHQVPWCERCERDLDVFPPHPFAGPVGQAISRWQNKVGYGLNRRLFVELSSRASWRPRITVSFVVVFAVSLLLLATIAAAVVGGALLIINGRGLVPIVGVLMIAMAILLRPRLGSVKKIAAEYDEVTRADAPHLFALLDRSAQALGAKPIHRVFVGPEWNAYASTVGWRRRRVLVLGVPLWVCLRPQERVFVVGHELGHFVNRDIRRGLLTQPACTIFGDLADLVRPEPTFGDEVDPMMRIVKAMRMPVQWALSHVLNSIHLAITMLAARDSQRAEYQADVMALQLAGGSAASALDMLSETFSAIVASRARGNHGFAGWADAVEQARAQRKDRVHRIRQLSQRTEASPLRSHPPIGLRHRMAIAVPHHDPLVVLTDEATARIDAELKRFEERYRAVMAHSEW